jgi:hypothetical protein
MKKAFLLTTIVSAWILGTAPLLAQPWSSAQSMLLFRATTNQAVAGTKISQSALCIAQLRTLASAALNYAYDDYGGQLPSNWSDFTNNMSGPQYLYCPADLAHPAQSDWTNVNFSAVSYEIVSPGCKDSEITKVFLKCSVHSNIAYVDGVTEEFRPYERIPAGSTPNALVWHLPATQVALDKSPAIKCINNLKQIGVAGQVWGQDHGFMPTSLSQISNELVLIDKLYCPADKTNVPPHSTNFASVNYASLDYTLVSPGVSSDAITNVFARCRLHGSYVLVDGSAYMGTNRIPPRIMVGNPLWQTVEPGANVTLSVLTGTDPTLQPFSFQWRKKQPIDAAGNPFTNTVLIAGATNSSLTFTNAQATNEGYYDVVVRDATGGYQESAIAYLRVEPLSNIKSLSWQRLVCISNLRQIGTAARLSLNADSPDNFPASLSGLAPYLGWPASLFCPSDSRTAPSSWSQVNFANTSYTWTSGLTDYDVTNVMATCKVHGYILRADGSVDAASFAAPQLNVQTSAGKTILSWTNAGCSLQSANNSTGPYLDIAGATAPYTNSATTSQHYFRLHAN